MSASSIHTFTGLLVDPLDLKPEDVRIEDIAHALSNQCRFQGHTSAFYSVAQHAVLVSRLVPPQDALAGLLHDASEAYLQDMARPLKVDPYFGKTYRGAESRAQRMIEGVFGLGHEPQSVKDADLKVLVTEARDLMHGTEEWPYYQTETPLDMVIVAWGPNRAERGFLRRFEALT